MENLKKIYIKNKELINYLIFGVLTTVVNFIVYYGLDTFKIDKTISNSIAWFASVLFAYITNKLYVFESKKISFDIIKDELVKFFGCRLFSGVLDIGMFFVMVNLLKLNDFFTKCFIAVFVVVLNYVFSKLFIFKDKDKKEG